VSATSPRYSQIPQIKFINRHMGAGAAGRHLLSHLTKASLLPDDTACGSLYERIEHIDLESFARQRVQPIKSIC
jgi:hypothetical protein